MHRAVTAVSIAVLTSMAGSARAQTLRGSPVAMARQNRVAVDHDFTFLQTSSDVSRFVDLGLLVRLSGNGDYELAGVSHPYARPAVRLFVERLSTQYHSACSEKLVVTSLTRPVREQPRNASDLSVHPAGMAVDLRVSNRRSCRNWLERTLLSLEKQGVLEAGRERNPPHYHVALFPEPYARYVTRLTGSTSTFRVAGTAPPPTASTASAVAATESEDGASSSDPADEAVNAYRVNRGDSLWSIARRFGTSVDTLKELNGLRGSQIVAGQVIAVPALAGAGSD